MAENHRHAKKRNALIAAALLWVLAMSCAIAQEKAQPRAERQGTGTPAASGRFKNKQASEPDLRPAGTRMMISGKYLHLSCSRSLRDLARNRLECFGNVYIRRPSELLTSDYAVMDLNTEQLHAEGNVVYFTPDTVIYGTRMDFNFLTETGVVTEGRVESDKYQLVGEKIERLGLNQFVAHDGEYTTCRDCPASWKLAGQKVDLTVEGYAHLKNVYIKINEAPSLYLPYAIIPVKTKRQSGLLFPRLQLTGPNGFTFLQPYFWAISRNMDATIATGLYSLRGLKSEGEFRYVLGDRSRGQFNGFYLRDKSFIRDPYYNRWALNYNHNLELPWGIEQRLSYIDASDRDYPSKIGDIPGRGEPGLISEAGLSRTSRDFSWAVTTKRIRNQLTPSLVGFDPNTVQLLPSVSIASQDHRFLKDVPLYWGVQMNYSRFWRNGTSFDPIYPVDFLAPSENFFLPGITPLRRAQRFNLVPELYYTARLADVIELVPSVQYRTYGYLFDQGVAAPTARGYLLAQGEVATSIERVYGSRVKHKFRPSLTYSNIPVIQQNNEHPFIRQIKTAGNEFDSFDIVPITNETPLYFVPLGNSLAYRLGNKFILKDGGTYRKVVDVVSGQSVNFIEFRGNPNPRPLSQFFTFATVDTQRLTGRLEYFYYPYVRQPTYNLGLDYIFSRYTRRLLSFNQSIGIAYSYNQVTTTAHTIGGQFNWSISDYLGFVGGISYSLPQVRNNAETPGVIQAINGGVTFQSPSQCYKVVLLASRTIDNPKVSINFNLPINLTGEGFMDIQEGGGLVPGR